MPDQMMREQTSTPSARRDERATVPAAARPGNGAGAIATTMGAAALVALGLLRGGRRWPLMLAGLGLGAVGLRKLVRAQPAQGVKVSKAITIDRPRDEVYRRWRQVEELAVVFQHVDDVQWAGDDRIRWTARLTRRGPPLQWMTELVEDREGELIRWRSMPQSIVHNEGSVQFLDAPGGRGTEVHVRLSYRPGMAPGGRTTARAFRPLVAHEILADLHRFKQLLETGEIATNRTRPTAWERG